MRSIIAPKKIAPKNIPRYIQCGIYRTGERILQESTGAYIDYRSIGDVHVSRGSSDSRWDIWWGFTREAIDEYGTNILDQIPPWGR